MLAHKIKGRSPLRGCLSPTMHLYLAWTFVPFFLMLISTISAISIVSARCRTTRHSASVEGEKGAISMPDAPEDESPDRLCSGPSPSSKKQPDVYSVVELHARNVKAILQMMIGIAAVCVVGWRFLDVPIDNTHQATTLLIDGIGVGLAAAAALELAYTLFTPGPDEALDPLMLAVAAALLIQIARIEQTPSPGTVAALLLQGLLLAVLFATRLMLVERSENDPGRPNIWWVLKILARRHMNR